MEWVVILAMSGPIHAENDNASVQGNLGQCLMSLKSQNLLPHDWQLGPGASPTTFSEFSKEEGNTILFHTPNASYKINLAGRGSETYSPKDGQGYYALLEPIIKKSDKLTDLAASCGSVDQFKHLFQRLPAKADEKSKSPSQ